MTDSNPAAQDITLCKCGRGKGEHPYFNGSLLCGKFEPVAKPAISKPENPYAKRKDIVTKCWQEGYEAGSKPKVPSLEQIEKILVSFIEEQDPLCNRTIGAYTTAILKLMEEGV